MNLAQRLVKVRSLVGIGMWDYGDGGRWIAAAESRERAEEVSLAKIWSCLYDICWWLLSFDHRGELQFDQLGAIIQISFLCFNDLKSERIEISRAPRKCREGKERKFLIMISSGHVRM